MKMQKNIIKAVSLFLISAFVLGGCASGKTARVVKAERIIRADETVNETGNTESLKPAQPENVRYSYDEISKVLKIKWKKADNAVSYEIQYMSQPVASFKTTECFVRNVEKDSKIVFRIRSVSANNEHSAWVTSSITVDNMVESPDYAGLRIDGDNVFFIWNQVENVDGYEIDYHAEGAQKNETVTVKAPGNYIFFKLEEGKKIDYAIRAFKVIGDKKYYSDRGEITYTNPRYVSLNEYGYLAACTLDAKRIEGFVKAKGGKISSTKTDGRFLVNVSLRDESQHTLKAVAKRFLKDVGEAFFEGYAEGVKENAIDTAVESEGVKDFINKLDEEATKNAKKNAFLRIFKRTKVDTDIHCIFQYKYTDLAPEMVKIAILKTNNKNYGRDFAASFAENRQKDGTYEFAVKGTGQRFYARLSENNNYWIITLYPAHIMNLSETAK